MLVKKTSMKGVIMTDIPDKYMQYPLWNLQANFYLKVALIFMIISLTVALYIFLFNWIKTNKK